jgi:hypothetical protein
MFIEDILDECRALSVQLSSMAMGACEEGRAPGAKEFKREQVGQCTAESALPCHFCSSSIFGSFTVTLVRSSRVVCRNSLPQSHHNPCLLVDVRIIHIVLNEQHIPFCQASANYLIILAGVSPSFWCGIF